MRSGGIALLVVGALLVGRASVGHAASDDERVFQANRAASRFLAIAEICPPFIPTDAPKARQYAEVYMETGKKLVGKNWGTLAHDEVERRLSEVSITGPQRWCEDQRRYLRELGVRVIFPQAR